MLTFFPPAKLNHLSFFIYCTTIICSKHWSENMDWSTNLMQLFVLVCATTEQPLHARKNELIFLWIRTVYEERLLKTRSLQTISNTEKQVHHEQRKSQTLLAPAAVSGTARVKPNGIFTFKSQAVVKSKCDDWTSSYWTWLETGICKDWSQKYVLTETKETKAAVHSVAHSNLTAQSGQYWEETLKHCWKMKVNLFFLYIWYICLTHSTFSQYTTL